MTEIFLKIANMSISASWIVLALVLLRLLLKKAPKWITVLLWGIVAVRLVCPFSIESVMSLIPSAETISPQALLETPAIDTGIPIINNTLNPIIQESTVTIAPEKSINTLQLLVLIFSKVWIVGVALMSAYTVISYFRVKRKISTAVLLRDNIYQSESVVSPFVLGIINSRIYLPFNMSEQDMEHVIAHEQAHIRRKDHWWKPLGFLLLTLHWFNPFMWLGYILLCRDIELACDEKVVKEMNTEQRADYSQALLTCSVNRRMISACPLAFGEVGVKNRVKSVLHYKKPAFWIIVAAIVASVVAAVCFLTNPRTTLDDELSVFLDMQIAEHHYSEGHTDGNFITVHHKVLDVDKSLNKTTVYMWVLYLEYSCENGEIKEEAGAHIPTVITVKRTGTHGHYELDEYWEPGDGSYYAEDIKEKFPWYLYDKALDSQRYIDEQEAFCRNAAEEYFSSTSDVGGAEPSEQVFESTVSYANWAEADEIYLGALNTDKMAISSVQHLPIYKFDTLQELEQFKQAFGSTFSMDSGWDEVPSFNNATAKYDSSFFEENSLMLVYVSAGNSTHRFSVQSMEHTDTFFCVHIEELTKAEIVDEAMAGWFVTVAVSDELIKSCTEFDADLNNGIELLNEVESSQD